MTLPTFIVFGTRKAGTTSIYHYLDQHPEVYMSTLKGTRYFMYEVDNPDKGKNIPVKTIERYKSYFRNGNKDGIKALGEVSPSYMGSKIAAKQMHAAIPHTTLIASLRNPVDKLYSQYQMEMRDIKKEHRKPLTHSNAHEWKGAGMYATQMSEYLKYFRKEQMSILIFEEWIKNPGTMIKNVYEKIGVDNSFCPDFNLQYNSGGVPKNEMMGALLKHRPIYTKLKAFIPVGIKNTVNRMRNNNLEKAQPLDADLRAHLYELYKDEIDKLQDLLNKDLSIWRPSN